MSGPPYPRPVPAPGSNAIGEFVIGHSPIGAIGPAFDVWLTIISQYANSPILTQIITDFFDALDQTADIQSFFDLIWNVDTAQGFGLDVWGAIVNIARVVHVPTPQQYFGFNESVDDGQPFGQAPFFAGGTLTQNYVLTDPAYRALILAKALGNICDGSTSALNALLRTLFPGRGNCYVIDNHNMTITYNFAFNLSEVELAIVTTVLPRPTGVSATIASGTGV
jgi:hypothetical protein